MIHEDLDFEMLQSILFTNLLKKDYVDQTLTAIGFQSFCIASLLSLVALGIISLYMKLYGRLLISEEHETHLDIEGEKGSMKS